MKLRLGQTAGLRAVRIEGQAAPPVLTEARLPTPALAAPDSRDPGGWGLPGGDAGGWGAPGPVPEPALAIDMGEFAGALGDSLSTDGA